MISLLFIVLVVSHFGFEGKNMVLIAPVPDQSLPFTLLKTISISFVALCTYSYEFEHKSKDQTKLVKGFQKL